MADTPFFPPQLEQAMARFQHRWRLLHTLRVAGLFVFIPLISFGLLALSDRVWATPRTVRLLVSGPVPVLYLLLLWPWLRQWILRKPDPRTLARVMGRLDRRIGDRLLGAVELAEGVNLPRGDSPALRRAAIEQVARELADVRAEELLDTTKLRKLSRISTLLLLAGFLFVHLSPDAARNSFSRWLRPHREIGRFTFIRFQNLPPLLHTAHGEAYSFSASVSHIRGKPLPPVEVRMDGPERLEFSLEDGKLTVSGEGITQARTVQLRAGDARAEVHVLPRLRPELTTLDATIHWPTYLDREPEHRSLRRRRIEALPGSRIALNATVSQPLRDARGPGGIPLPVDGSSFHLSPILLEADQIVELNWTDDAGLRPSLPATVELTVRADEPPRVSIAGLAPAVAALPDEFIEFEVHAGDDFGLQRVWTRMRVLRGTPSAERTTDLHLQGRSGTASQTFSPERAGFAAGDIVELVAKAVDAFPGREPSRSTRHRILILSHEDHAKRIHQQMESVLADLDELIRLESQALAENRGLSGQGLEAIAAEGNDTELSGRAREEQLRAERLADTRRRMERLISESAKNHTISDETLAEWTGTAQILQHEAQPAMQAAVRSLEAAAQADGGSGAAERLQNLETAMQNQEKAIAAMQRGEEELADTLERSVAESFVNRLRELSRLQENIGKGLEELLPRSIGLPPAELPGDLSKLIQENARKQEKIHRESRHVFDDLNGFYRRTRQEIFREIAGDMQAERFSSRLPELRVQILDNTIGRAFREAGVWRDLFANWADRLSPPQDSGSTGAAGGAEAPPEAGEDLETMIALMRTREDQERLRRHTRSLDESYAENMNYHREAVELSDRQYGLAMNLQRLENRVRTQEVRQRISLASGEIMNAGVLLRRPQTDSETRAAQTLVIELLAEALDQSMGGAAPEPDSAAAQIRRQNQQQLQALMQMMQGLRTADQGGEGMTGAGTPAHRIAESPHRETERRRGDGAPAAAVDPDRWPGEYRDLIEAYYQWMEDGE